MKQGFFLSGEEDEKIYNNSSIIKSISYDQDELLQWIKTLYLPNGIDYDPTYSKGNFYKHIEEPKFKSDLSPQTNDMFKCNCNCLPIKDESFNSIVFDPPFVGACPATEDTRHWGIIKKRFGFYKTIEDLWYMYSKAMKEFYRVLKDDGILVVKCMDTILSSKQYLSHNFLINEGYLIGFYPIDLFILLARNKLIGWTNKTGQKHCRKFHSYFVIFKKTECKINYLIERKKP